MSSEQRMEIQLVAIEREDSVQETVYGTSGIMIDKKYIITTSNILLPLFNNYFFEKILLLEPEKIYSSFPLKSDMFLKIIWKDNKNLDKYCIHDGEVFALFTSKNIKTTARQVLQGWTIDTPENSKEIDTILSLFFVIKIIPSGDIADLKNSLMKWWDLIKNQEINQSDEILIKSVPFGNRVFFNSFSQGIVSNVVGSNSCLILSDCSTTPGSEGSPMYKSHSDVPCGMVISSSCWWKKDWTGLTLIIDIRAILTELLVCHQYQINLRRPPHYSLIASVETCFVQVYCGTQWGTAIVLDIENGILLTNSHVITTNCDIKLYWKGKMDVAKVVYKTPNKEVYDLAVLKCNLSFLRSNNIKSIGVLQKPIIKGEEVFSVGFAIFSQNISSNPTISKGFVTQINKSMIKTTCCVNAGMSGGAILNNVGKLVGVIVCNSRLESNVYPRFNMAIPYVNIEGVMQEYLKTTDSLVLHKLYLKDSNLTSSWKFLESKL